MSRLLAFLILGLTGAVTTHAGQLIGSSPFEVAQNQAENEVRGRIEPILSRYCGEQCKVLSVSANIQIVSPENVAPGFDDMLTANSAELAPASVKVKLLIDELVGPNSRSKILDLIREYVDIFPHPVFIETKLARFPQPAEHAKKVAELKEDLAKRFQDALTQVINKTCPDQCMIGEVEVKAYPVNIEEAQCGNPGDYLTDGMTAIHVDKLKAMLLLDQQMLPEERASVLELARLKTNQFKKVEIDGTALKFPGILAADGEGRAGKERVGKDGRSLASEQKNLTDKRESTNSNTFQNESETEQTQNSQTSNNTTSNDVRQERFERIEKIERVENGDAIQEELKQFRFYAMIFALAILVLLVIFIAVSGRSKTLAPVFSPMKRALDSMMGRNPDPGVGGPAPIKNEVKQQLAKRVEIDRLRSELMSIYAEQPKVAKATFSRVLTEDGIEVMSAYVHIFGDVILVDMLRDPSLQRDLSDLMEYFAKNQIDLKLEDELDLLKRLHNRTIAAKMGVLGNRTSNLFEFLVEMDYQQIRELIRNESVTVMAIVLTQCDTQKRQSIYNGLDSNSQMNLLTELSRVDHLPKEYVQNVATALNRKRTENPRLNTEALPGSEVLVGLLERADFNTQKIVMRSLDNANPEIARSVRHKLISIDTLPYLRDSHLREVVMELKHEELLQFLKGTPAQVAKAVLAKTPKDMAADLEEQLKHIPQVGRDTYNSVERKILNRIKTMAKEGTINLGDIAEKMYGRNTGSSTGSMELRKASGW